MVWGWDWGMAFCCSDIGWLPSDSIVPGRVYGERIYIFGNRGREWVMRDFGPGSFRNGPASGRRRQAFSKRFKEAAPYLSNELFRPYAKRSQ
jgi:hypothetical protein